MNQFKESLNWVFYKTYTKSKENKKVYRKRILKVSELEENDYLGGVSCFIIDEKGNILIEKRGNTKITAGQIDLCSGHIDSNETPTQAMVREYIEELHNGEEKEIAKNEAIQNLKKLEELDLIFKNDRKFFIQFYVMKTKLKNTTIQKEEVNSVEWLPMQEVFELIRQGKTKFKYDQRYEKIFKQVEDYYNMKKSQNMQIEER